MNKSNAIMAVFSVALALLMAIGLASAIELNDGFTIDRSFLTKDSEFRHPAIAFTDSGDMVVTWIKTAPLRTGSTVYVQLFDFSGNPKSNATAVTDDLLPKYNQVVDFNPYTQNIIISWQEGKSKEEINSMRFTKDLKPIGTIARLGSTGYRQIKPSAATTLNGNYAIVWQDTSISQSANDQSNIVMAAYDKDMQGISDGDLNIATGAPQQTDPSIIALTDSRFAVIYTSIVSPLSYGMDIKGRTLQVDGNYSSEFDVVTEVGDQFNQKAFRSDAGTIGVLWESVESGSSNIYGMKISDNGTVITPKFTVTRNPESENALDVASDDAGNFVVAWQEENPVEGSKVKARLFNSDTTGSGDIVEMPRSAKYNTKPSVAIYGDRIAFAYESYDGFARNIEVIPAYKQLQAKTAEEARVAAIEKARQESSAPTEPAVAPSQKKAWIFQIWDFIVGIFK